MSCLFRSLSHAVGVYPDQLRKIVAAYIKTNPKLIDDLDTKTIIGITENGDLDHYADKMASNDAWGGALEIKAFCELFKKDVVVHVLYTNQKFSIHCSRPIHNIIHISYTGDHFEPLYIEIV